MRLVFDFPGPTALDAEMGPAQIAGLVANQLLHMLESNGIGKAIRIVVGIERTFDVDPDPLELRLASATPAWKLTRRQAEVMRLIARGDANKEIAANLGCAENTVELHVTALLRRVGVSSRTQLVARFWSETWA
jgi:DNA-binding NarL/FixJ family response regulator